MFANDLVTACLFICPSCITVSCDRKERPGSHASNLEALQIQRLGTVFGYAVFVARLVELGEPEFYGIQSQYLIVRRDSLEDSA